MHWRLANDLRELRDLRRNLTVALEEHSVEGSDIQGSVLATSELVTNAISYSDGEVDVTVEWIGTSVVLTVADHGPGFDLTAVSQPGTHEASGRGLLIVSKIVSDLRVIPNDPTGALVSAVLPVRPACVPAADVDATRGDERALAASPGSELSRFQLRPVADFSLGLGVAPELRRV